jgi:signal transduction histidine kinase/HAMP domain-containing protein
MLAKRKQGKSQLKRFSLHTTLAVVFGLQLVAVAAVIEYLSYKNSQEAIADLASQLMIETGNRIKENLENYLDQVKDVNQLNTAHISKGLEDWQDFNFLERHFIEYLQVFPAINSIAIATESQDFLAVGRNFQANNNEFLLRIKNTTTNNELHRYLINANAELIKLLEVRKGYNPHQDPPEGESWYQATIESNQPIWRVVVSLIKGRENPILILTYLSKIEDPNGRVIGVLGSVIFLPEFSNFLEGLAIGKTGQAMIIDHEGLIVASSTGESVFREDLQADYQTNLEPEKWRISAQDSHNEQTRAAVSYLQNNFGGLNTISKTIQARFAIAGEPYWLRAIPIQDADGLDWLILVVVPESDFLGQTKKNTQQTKLHIVIAVAIAIGLTIWLARIITKPIKALNQASKAIAGGEWGKVVDIHRNDEIGDLAKSFNTMSAQVANHLAELASLYQELANNEERFRVAIKDSPITVCNQDLNLLYTWVYNCKMGSEEHAIGKTDIELFPASAAQAARNITQLKREVIESGKGKRTQVWYSLDGIEERCMDLIVEPLQNQLGEITGITCAGIDITQQKQLELEVLKTLDRERELNELKSRFVTTVSHEFRNPLAVIISAASNLESYGHKLSESKKLKRLRNIKASCNYMSALLNDVLLLGKVEAGKFSCNLELVYIPRLCLDIVEELKAFKLQETGIEADRQIRVSAEGDFQHAYIDPKITKLVLLNLLSNAVKYSPEDSIVDLIVTTNQDVTIFQVIDRGIGIPEKDLKNLFQPFHRAGNVENISGTGLGLSIVQELVVRHGGKIEFTSEEGKGSTFMVTLPNRSPNV